MPEKAQFLPPRGTRDFYPEQMRPRNGLFSLWRNVAGAFGFVEYDSCVLEHEELYILKSGEEIVGQLFNFTDKGGRRVALRPEMTPSLARMIAARGSTLPRPLKWFSIAQCFRYERMARGRKREHYQWNLDIVGVPEVTAEAELLAAAIEVLERLGLRESDLVVRISHRGLLTAALEALEIAPGQWPSLLGIIDKRGKESEESLWKLLLALRIPEARLRGLLSLLEGGDLDAFRALLEPKGLGQDTIVQIEALFGYLEAYGIRDYCEFAPSVVRGLPYYTGTVFECFDREGRFRAVFGGGRYDRLLEVFGAEPSPAAGLGFGDVVIQELLEARTLQPWPDRRMDFFLVPFSEAERSVSMRVARDLRKKGFAVDLLLGTRKLKAALRESVRSRPGRVVLFLPDELDRGALVVRDMSSGQEERVSMEVFLDAPQRWAGPG
ncbi:MAG: histidine--tRNA ligase [bacterium]